ncbi:MAG: substrate-binding domain-containing protein, partial [Geminicoccaceae bacterium]|nr:substrate-binding domain-containing protein [Geminicoccaceae bacterium]
SDDLTSMVETRRVDLVVTGLPPADAEPFEVLPVLTEPFIVVVARRRMASHASLEEMRKLPFVHYGRSMPMGRRIIQHLRRLRIDLPERYSFDATRSVFAMVKTIGGWAITTPLCVCDSERFWPELEFRPLPFAGFARTIHLVARRGELGHLPEDLAARCRALIRSRLVSKIEPIMPWVGDDFRVLGEDEAVTRAAACGPSAAEC